jgi:hypothetical protein
MHRRFVGLKLLALLCAAAPALPAMAHHGWSGNEAEITVSGVLETGLSLSGPHGTMQVRDAEGTLWDITLAPAPRTHRAGLREGTIPEGASVTVHGERSRDPDRNEMKVRRVTHDDVHYDVYPPKRS